MSFPNILISIKKFDYHLLISQIKRKNVVNRKEVRSEECDELTAKKKRPGYIIDFEAKKSDLPCSKLLRSPKKFSKYERSGKAVKPNWRVDEAGHRLFPHWFLPEMFLSKIKNIICVLELSTKNITVEA